MRDLLSVTIEPDSTVDLDVAFVGGAVFSDAAGESAVSMPDSISGSSTYFFDRNDLDTLTVTVTLGDLELVSQRVDGAVGRGESAHGTIRVTSAAIDSLAKQVSVVGGGGGGGGGGGAIADDRISLSSSGATGIVENVQTSIHWDSVDRTAGTGAAVDAGNNARVNVTEGTYAIMFSAEMDGPTSMYMFMAPEGDSPWPYDSYEEAFGVLPGTPSNPTHVACSRTVIIQFGPDGGWIHCNVTPRGAGGDLVYAGLDIKRLA